MADICSTCGLPNDICACEPLSLEQQLVVIRLEARKWNKPTTIIEGIDTRRINLRNLAGEMKTNCACGGTAKDKQIILQGDQREKVRKLLLKRGFPEANIETH